MSEIITREMLRDVLLKWQRGDTSHGEVHAWAEARYAVDSFEPEDAVANEILAHLDILDINVTVPEDIPYLLSALDAVTLDEAVAVLKTTPFDLEDRRRRYGNDPVYGPVLR